MTQEDKELLLKDLCARLPYGVKIYTKDGKNDASFILKISDLNWIFEDNRIDEMYEYDGWKPYLRPMSSMTNEEEKELNKKFDFYIQLPIWKGDCKIINLRPYGINQHLTTNVDNSVLSMLVDWLNKHHFDHRGLIEKGLALEAPEGMYNIKEK